jgi:hypothetical protein
MNETESSVWERGSAMSETDSPVCKIDSRISETESSVCDSHLRTDETASRLHETDAWAACVASARSSFTTRRAEDPGDAQSLTPKPFAVDDPTVCRVAPGRLLRGPSQIRTCAIRASGSSRHGFAARSWGGRMSRGGGSG